MYCNDSALAASSAAMSNPFIRAIPPSLVRFFARPYVAGDSLAKAVDTAADMLRSRGLLTTLDLLAEEITSQADVEENLATYLEMINAASGDDRFITTKQRPTVSLKLSSFTLAPLDRGGDGAGSREAAMRLAEHSKQRNVRLTIDMENSDWTDFTLDTVAALHDKGHHHVGTVIQTRLHRTDSDLDRLPKGCRVRLVIGIYQERAKIAFTDKHKMKERLLTLGSELLKRGHCVELATHDEAYVRRFFDEVVPQTGAQPHKFEAQMLYGVPRMTLQKELVERGIPTRLYLPFARSWSMAIAYLRRRLDEYPAMMFSVLGDVIRSRGRA
ncbi:MAG: hypothetical protein A2289_12835 [Deltaproteobacteria bacterium RIFOXYA12_FULL_58_15]|nr:MAG: hypothetical protein A2289_12835 [Deltaproteobacteria bacterium RIFOXYA12_FULL_58_15]OGR11624.1 MAG: hypothetical protein A2341_05775 [Deltaproteobacteria bacterium RIFOXYB12_FULL_58_9]